MLVGARMNTGNRYTCTTFIDLWQVGGGKTFSLSMGALKT